MRKLILRSWTSPTLMTWLNLFVRTGGLLVLTPLIVTRLGQAEIAAWYLFSSVIALAALADFGFAPTFSRNIAFAMSGAVRLENYAAGASRAGTAGASPNWDLVRRLVQTMRFVYALSTGVMCLVLVLAGQGAVGPTLRALADPGRGWLAWQVVWVGAALTFAASGYATVLAGLNRVAQSHRVGAIGNSLSTALSATSLLLGADLLVLVLVYQTVTFLAALAQRFVLRSEFPGLLDRWTIGIDREVFAAIWPPAWRTAAGIAGSTGVAHATSVMVAQLEGTASVANYLLTVRVFGTLVAFCQAPFYSKIPVFAQLRARGELASLAETSRKAMQRSFAVFVASTTACGLVANLALAWIDANARLVDGPFWSALMIVFFLERHHAMHAQIYSTTNHIPFYVPTAISGAINIAFVAATLQDLKLWAVVAGQGFSNALWNNWWNVKISLRTLPDAARGRFLRVFAVWFGVALLGAGLCWMKSWMSHAL